MFSGYEHEGLTKTYCTEHGGSWDRVSYKCVFSDAAKLNAFALPTTTACSGSGGNWTCARNYGCFCQCDSNKVLNQTTGKCEWKSDVLNDWTERCNVKGGQLTVIPDSITCKICGLDVDQKSNCLASGSWVAGTISNNNCCVYDDREKMSGSTI